MYFRKLTKNEITLLEANGCRAENWEDVEVKDGFQPVRCRDVYFSGKVKLGVFRRDYFSDSGVIFRSGIEKALIHNCTVEDDVSVYNVSDFIGNYHIGEGAVIRNCGKICVEGVTSFGNGIDVDVMNESGGRRIKIWDRLSSHIAYIMVLYRHRPEMLMKLEEMIRSYAERRKSDTGYIGKNSRIFNCTVIRNVWIGNGAHIEGSLYLNEGSLNSSEADPVFAGPGVIMNHFIISSGSAVTESAMVERCFIGQGCHLGKQFSAHNSLFFANCQGFHGEVYSVFAGPYTVTHHKSTLLIAGIFSFMNAGSGSNQSNHMYKLGPVHQGVVERGTKTASDSYMLWPARIGPYSLVNGRHLKNIDTSLFPFSYIMENNRETVLIPALNLVSSGTIRDAIKWPKRDVRKDRELYDHICFNYLSPFTAGRILKAIQMLEWIKDNCRKNEDTDYYCYNDSLKISAQALERGIEIYRKGLDRFAGEVVLEKLSENGALQAFEKKEIFNDICKSWSGEWVDLAGLIAPSDEVENLIGRIESGVINSTDMISEAFKQMFTDYKKMEWSWVVFYLEQVTGKSVRHFSYRDICAIIRKYIESIDYLGERLLEDAGKEFSIRSMTGFGIDGDDEVRKNDYLQVRGSYENHPVVEAVRSEMNEKKRRAESLIKKLEIYC